jgi:hypothetical protein
MIARVANQYVINPEDAITPLRAPDNTEIPRFPAKLSNLLTLTGMCIYFYVLGNIIALSRERNRVLCLGHILLREKEFSVGIIILGDILFEKTCANILCLGQRVDAILSSLEQSTDGDLDVRRQRLRKYCGMRVQLLS